MHKLTIIALLAAFAIVTPALADDTPSGVAADVGAVQKDNAALAKDNADIARHRAAKAQDKANGNIGSQAIDSVNIGADKAKRGEKTEEKSYDQKTLNSDVNSATTKAQ